MPFSQSFASKTNAKLIEFAYGFSMYVFGINCLHFYVTRRSGWGRVMNRYFSYLCNVVKKANYEQSRI